MPKPGKKKMSSFEKEARKLQQKAEEGNIRSFGYGSKYNEVEEDNLYDVDYDTPVDLHAVYFD